VESEGVSMSSFRSLYVNRTKYPHRKPLPESDAVQPSLFEQTAAPKPAGTPRKPKPSVVISPEPLPKRIYESNGLIFGLYDGGQEYFHVEIQWTYLKPAHVSRVEREEQ
jgi:hypothetical protein